MASEFNDSEAEELYGNLLETGKKSFEEKLWNGEILNNAD